MQLTRMIGGGFGDLQFTLAVPTTLAPEPLMSLWWVSGHSSLAAIDAPTGRVVSV